MSDQLAVDALPNDLYLMRAGSQWTVVYKQGEYFNTLTGMEFSKTYADNRGWTIEPVHVLTITEHAALLAEVEALRAQVAEKEAHIEHLTEINTIAAQTISTLQDYRTSLTAQVARLQGEAGG